MRFSQYCGKMTAFRGKAFIVHSNTCQLHHVISLSRVSFPYKKFGLGCT